MITNYLYALIGTQEERGVNMAKLEREINTDFDELINRIEKEILDGSISATLEDSSDFEVVAINDLSDAKELAHLLKYDSSQGTYKKDEIGNFGNYLVSSGRKIKIFSSSDPLELPWGELGVDIVFVVSFVFSKYISSVFRKERAAISDLNSFLSENIAGMKLTQIFNQEERKDEEFVEKNNEIYKQTRNVIKGFGIFRPLVSTIYNLSVALSFTLGVIFHLTAGEIVAFYLFLSRFFNPIQDLADQLNALQKAFTASERIFNLLDVKPDVLDSEDALEIDNFKGHIEFKNVWFAYEGEDWILKDVSFKIEPKTTCAFVMAQFEYIPKYVWGIFSFTFGIAIVCGCFMEKDVLY